MERENRLDWLHDLVRGSLLDDIIGTVNDEVWHGGTAFLYHMIGWLLYIKRRYHNSTCN